MSITETPTYTGTWQVDPVHSTVGFEVAYMAGTFKGEFRDIAATLTVEGAARAPRGQREGRQRRREGREPECPSAVA